MDYLPYDLVEEVVSFLPRSDVETIAKVSSRSTDLENWSFAAGDQLENRVLLDVYAYVQSVLVTKQLGPSIFIEDGVESRIFLSATRDLPNGDKEEWNFTKWRLAWIRSLTIDGSFEHCPYPEADIQKALRSISLPVDPSARGSFTIGVNMLYRFQETLDVYRRMIEAAQKEFVNVELNDDGRDSYKTEQLAIGFLNKGVFLEDMDLQGCYLPRATMAGISEAIASEFGRKRGRPLEVRIPFNSSEEIVSIVERIAENWQESDGAFEEKRVVWDGFYGGLWLAITDIFNAVVEPTALSGYLPHPTRRSSLFVSYDQVGIVKFQTWHAPVRFEWIESVIAEWKNGSGFYVYRGEREFIFKLTSKLGRLKFQKKYQPWLKKHRDIGVFSFVTHPSKLLKLKITKYGKTFEVSVQHEKFSEERVEALISDWKKGDGESLINGLTEIEVEPPRVAGPHRIPPVRSISHPIANARCLIVGKECSDQDVVRISITSIDPEDVDDWNLQNLFGSFEV